MQEVTSTENQNIPLENQEISFKQISQKCRQTVPTPRGSILQPPRASQVPQTAGNKIIEFMYIFLYIPSLLSAYAGCYIRG